MLNAAQAVSISLFRHTREACRDKVRPLEIPLFPFSIPPRLPPDIDTRAAFWSRGCQLRRIAATTFKSRVHVSRVKGDAVQVSFFFACFFYGINQLTIVHLSSRWFIRKIFVTSDNRINRIRTVRNRTNARVDARVGWKFGHAFGRGVAQKGAMDRISETHRPSLNPRTH